MKKEVFVKKFKELTKGYKNQDVADLLGKGLDLINKYRSDTNNTMPGRDGILRICEVFHCDPNYLFLEEETAFNPEYKEIERITGLSSKSIEVLNYIQQNTGKKKNGMSFGKNVDTYSWKNTAMINDILEEIYENLDDIKQNKRPINSVLSRMRDYTHTEFIEYQHNDDELFYDQESHARYIVEPVSLLRTKLLIDIQEWLKKHEKPRS